jgi:hypothetical protein
MTIAREIPLFARESWYTDHNDHRCPHDAWLESLEIGESAQGSRKEIREKFIRFRLLGAYHDGHLVFQYSAVKKYSVSCVSADLGHGDWLEDKISISEFGELVHEIQWARGSWTIVAETITCDWIIPTVPN